MKFSTLSVGILALLTPLTAAWSKEDREIFRIRDEISAHEVDPDATFYDILGVQKHASQDTINQAYRKRTRELHPDKVRQQLRAKDGAKSNKGPSASVLKAAVKKASDQQTRLSLIVGILRGPLRDRYDHFLSNGFPLWKGTDYYYNRYRPGLGTVITGLLLFTGGAVHYLILYMNWKRQKEFVGRYVKFARNTAWGGNIPGLNTAAAAAPAPVADEEEEDPAMLLPRNRKERRFLEKESRKDDGRPVKKKDRKARIVSKPLSGDGSVAPTGVKKRVVAENGKVLVVDSMGDVFLEEQDDEGNVHEFLLDPEELAAPTYKDTAVVQVPLFLFRVSVGRLFRSKAGAEDEGDEVADDDSDAPQPTPSTDSAGEDYEVISKSTESLSKAKTSGAQQGGKPNKRKNKKK